MAAPIAHFDDDWPVLGELSMVSDQRLLPRKGRVSAAGEAAAAPQLLPDEDGDIPELYDSSFSPGDTGAFRSMEDLVNDFDEKLSACFRNFDARTDSIAPVSEITEESLLDRDEWVSVCPAGPQADCLQAVWSYHFYVSKWAVSAVLCLNSLYQGVSVHQSGLHCVFTRVWWGYSDSYTLSATIFPHHNSAHRTTEETHCGNVGWIIYRFNRTGALISV